MRKGERQTLADAVDAYLALPSDAGIPGLSVFGDLRLRAEYTDAPQQDRLRYRVRFRLGATYEWQERIMIGVRLTTGDPDDPNSPYQTLGSGFDSFEISLDRVFVRWRPRGLEGTDVTAGKFALPFHRNPVYGELVWDLDVQPEGVAITHTREIGRTRVDACLGAVTLLEQSDGEDFYGIIAQGSASAPVGAGVVLRAAAGYTWWSNVNAAAIVADNAGNAVIDTNGDGTPDRYVSDFGILNVVTAVEGKVGELSLTASAEYILNTRAAIAGDQGLALGVAAGKKGKRGNWWAYYHWQIVEQDAVFSMMAQDDFVQQTNFRGHMFGVRYYPLDRLELHLWCLISKPETPPPGGSSGTTTRIRFDITFMF